MTWHSPIAENHGHVSMETHTRAVGWVAERIGAEEVGQDASYHLRANTGKRVKVAGRRIHGRQPNFFAVGSTLDGDPFDEFAVVLFEGDWTVRYAYLLPIAAVRTHHKQPGSQGCRLMIRGDDSWRRDPSAQSLT